MQHSRWRRFRALFASNAGSSVELVLIGNAYAAVAFGVALLFETNLSLTSSLYVAAATFFALTVFLLFRYTAWIAVCAGSITIGFASALLLFSFAGRLHPMARWPGGRETPRRSHGS